MKKQFIGSLIMVAIISTAAYAQNTPTKKAPAATPHVGTTINTNATSAGTKLIATPATAGQTKTTVSATPANKVTTPVATTAKATAAHPVKKSPLAKPAPVKPAGSK